MMDMKDIQEEDGFLSAEHTAHLFFPSTKVPAAQVDLGRLRLPPASIEVQATQDGKTEILVRYDAGTPVHAFQQIVRRLKEIEQKHS